MPLESPRTAIVVGATGQDGFYLSKFLLDKGYKVWGTTRRSIQALPDNKQPGGAYLATLDPLSLSEVEALIARIKSTEIYNLAGQSSVGFSYQDPIATFRSIEVVTLNLLEAIRRVGISIRFFSAGSGESFGDTGGIPADENTCFRPISPYAAAKAAAHHHVAVYRESYGLFACTGFLFNHESPMRTAQFVTRKIVQAAKQIASGKQDKLHLGNLNISRDWGWAPEYVSAMWKMLNVKNAEDYVIATGVSQTLEDFVSVVFEEAGLLWSDWVSIDTDLFRPSDIPWSGGNPTKANALLNWQAESVGSSVPKKLFQAL